MSETDVKVEENVNEPAERETYLESELKSAIEKRQAIKAERDELKKQIEEIQRKSEEEKGKYKELYEKLTPELETTKKELEERQKALEEAQTKLTVIEKERRENLMKDLSDDEKKLAETFTTEQLTEYVKIKPTVRPNVDTSKARTRVDDEKKPSTFNEWKKTYLQ